MNRYNPSNKVRKHVMDKPTINPQQQTIYNDEKNADIIFEKLVWAQVGLPPDSR